MSTVDEREKACCSAASYESGSASAAAVMHALARAGDALLYVLANASQSEGAKPAGALQSPDIFF